MSGLWVVVQISLLACAYLPGVTQPARGAFLLMSFWCFGGMVGSRLAARKRGGVR